MRTTLLSVWLVFASLLGAAQPVHADAANPWLPGPNAAGDDTYSGAIDSPSNGVTLAPNSMVQVQGWVVDTTAAGWPGIDDVQVYLGLQDQGGLLMVDAPLGQRRDDVAAALGNPYFANAGFSAAFAETSLGTGSNTLRIYAHTPNKGWWYRQVQVTVPAPPARAYADDPLLIVREADPSLDVAQSTPTLTLRGYAIDRNLPLDQQLGVAGSGVSRLQAYVDGPRNGGGVFVGNATLGKQNREATGFGQRFLMSGFELTVHPNEFTVDRHEFYLYALSAYWPNETLVIIPFSIH